MTRAFVSLTMKLEEFDEDDAAALQEPDYEPACEESEPEIKTESQSDDLGIACVSSASMPARQRTKCKFCERSFASTKDLAAHIEASAYDGNYYCIGPRGISSRKSSVHPPGGIRKPRKQAKPVGAQSGPPSPQRRRSTTSSSSSAWQQLAFQRPTSLGTRDDIWHPDSPDSPELYTARALLSALSAQAKLPALAVSPRHPLSSRAPSPSGNNLNAFDDVLEGVPVMQTPARTRFAADLDAPRPRRRPGAAQSSTPSSSSARAVVQQRPASPAGRSPSPMALWPARPSPSPTTRSPSVDAGDWPPIPLMWPARLSPSPTNRSPRVDAGDRPPIPLMYLDLPDTHAHFLASTGRPFII
ncbi:hypothetical protein B0H16DRAFT_1712278 [Mycena metata]|uniref:C2H2-type domain-containing protein n=1 Tax=Mycena metata TaxID=1033252 RepID=A0AAD7K317_9AGAR|nr:hypothetical protein B0H16DRAFT_1712278 [Mycena metata]